MVEGNRMGQIEDVEKYMNKQTKDKVTDLSVIQVSTVGEYVKTNEIVIDGTTFYDGKDEVIPEHQVKTFRAFSSKLDSYVYLIYSEETNQYTMILNYDNDDEKESAKELTAGIQDIMESNSISIDSLEYSKFNNQSEDLNQVYKLSDQYESSLYRSHSRLWLMLRVDASTEDIRLIKDKIQSSIDGIEHHFSMEIITSDGRHITFYKDGIPLIMESDGQIEL